MLRADIEDVYGDARSCRVLGMVAADGLATAVPTRAPGDLRYQQHHDAADVDVDGNKVLSGAHDPGNRPSSGLGFELLSTHNHYRQRADAMRRLARAPGKRSQQALSQPREFCPHRFPPGWPGSLPTARAPQPSGCGHTSITRARLLNVVATPRHASFAAHRASSAWALRSLGPPGGPRPFRG